MKTQKINTRTQQLKEVKKSISTFSFCPICSYNNEDKNQVKEHINTHTDKELKEYIGYDDEQEINEVKN